MWVFGYGSLIWKADFPYKTKLAGYIKGFKRRFYQHSADHRGTPERPGRVVTLLESEPDDVVWGAAYEIEPEDEDSVTAYLDYREKNGYKQQTVTFYPKYRVLNKLGKKGSIIDAVVTPFELILYVGTEDNPHYAGPATIDVIAERIASSVGPSGTNKEYLYNLAESMRILAPQVEDEHLYALERAVRELEINEN